MKNVLFILCDQLRKDSLGCYGNPYAETPNLDRLAQNSVQFTRNYVANPICMPNRHTLFSGMYPRNHGVWTNGLLVRDSGDNLMHYLSENGYQTASIGKIHFEPDGCGAEDGSMESEELWKKKPEMNDFHGPFWGFDYIELADRHHGASGHMVDWFRKKGGTEEMFCSKLNPNDPETGVDPVPEELHSTAFVGERMCHYLEHIRAKDKPFFAVASFPDPHHPFIVPKSSAQRWENREVKPPIGTKEELSDRPMRYLQQAKGEWSRQGVKPAAYPDGLPESAARQRFAYTYAMVEMIDTQVGRILKTLDNLGLSEDTIVVFTSDHGELLGDYGLWMKGPFFLEGLLSTPLLISVPGYQHNGAVDHLFSSVDLAPTLCGLLGLEPSYYCDGQDQSAIWDAGLTETLRKSCLVEYRNGYGEKDCNYKVLITQDYKYVYNQKGERELFDLKNDGAERTNLLGNGRSHEYEPVMQSLLMQELLKTESKRPKQISLA